MSTTISREHLDSRCAEIQNLIISDNIQRAVRRLMDFVRDFGNDATYLNEAILISANFSKLERDMRKNLLAPGELQVQRNRLLDQMLNLFAEIRSGVQAAPPGTAPPSPPQTPSAEAFSAEAFSQPPSEASPRPTAEEQGEAPTSAPDSPSSEASPPERPLAEAEPKSRLRQPESAPVPLLTAQPLANPPATGNPSGVVCRFEGVHKTFKRSGFSLKDINLELRMGEITGLVGENGNGKTTLFRVLTGNLKHDQGKVSYPLFQTGRRLNWYTIKKRIAYVTQELPTWYGSLWENLTYEASVRGLSQRANRREVDYIVHRLGLIEYFDRRWHELSGGYKLRFALARALVWKPQLLVLDEPLANLDINAQLIVLNDLRDLAKSVKFPISIIVSSQHLHEIENIADKLVYLREGEIHFYGNRNQLGQDREYNSFEIFADIDYDTFVSRLEGLDIRAVEDNGLNFVLTTPLHISSHKVMEVLVRQQIPVTYFRDISTSTKKLFN